MKAQRIFEKFGLNGLVVYKFNAEKKQKLSRKDAEPQRYRKEKLCGFFAPSRLCMRLFLFGSGLSGL